MNDADIQHIKRDVALLQRDVMMLGALVEHYKKKNSKNDMRLLTISQNLGKRLDQRWASISGDVLEEKFDAVRKLNRLDSERLKKVRAEIQELTELTEDTTEITAGAFKALLAQVDHLSSGLVATINTYAEVSSWLLEHIVFHDKMIVVVGQLAKDKRWIKKVHEDDFGQVTVTLDNNETFTGPPKIFEATIDQRSADIAPDAVEAAGVA